MKQIIAEKEVAIAQKELTIAENELTITKKAALIAENELTIAQNQELIAKFQRMLFGQKSEKYTHLPPEQLRLDFGGKLSEQDIEAIETIINKKREEQKKKEKAEPKSSKRIALPVHLPIVETTIQPKGDLSEMVFVRNEVSDFLEYQPAKHFINRIIRPLYAPKAKEGSFLVASVPDSVFEKSKVAVSMVAHLLYGKFMMHLPIDRLLKELLREKIPTNSATIYNWVKLGITRLDILYEYKFQKILKQKYLQVDETTLKVLESTKQGASHLGYFWVYNDPINGSTVFKYQEGRQAHYPEAVLKDFSGYMQTDGYAGYKKLAMREDITQLCCWAHARRKFDEAQKNDQEKATIGLKLIQELYAVEQTARENKLNAQQRKALRLEKSFPVYNLLGKWIADNIEKTLPKSSIGKAIRYSFERWDELGNYFKDGMLEMIGRRTATTWSKTLLGQWQ